MEVLRHNDASGRQGPDDPLGVAADFNIAEGDEIPLCNAMSKSLSFAIDAFSLTPAFAAISPASAMRIGSEDPVPPLDLAAFAGFADLAVS